MQTVRDTVPVKPQRHEAQRPKVEAKDRQRAAVLAEHLGQLTELSDLQRLISPAVFDQGGSSTARKLSSIFSIRSGWPIPGALSCQFWITKICCSGKLDTVGKSPSQLKMSSLPWIRPLPLCVRAPMHSKNLLPVEHVLLSRRLATANEIVHFVHSSPFQIRKLSIFDPILNV